MKYLKLFEKQSDYQLFVESDSFVTPNVSFITEENKVFCHPYEEKIPNNVIKYAADKKLTEITVDWTPGLNINKFNTTIVSHEFVDGVGTIVFKEDITSIGSYAFYNCSELTSITIPDSVTSIEDGAFYDCSGLASIVIPDSVTSIDGETFQGCSSLTEVTIGSGVTSIGELAFYGCSSLTSIVIPDSVTFIGEHAFDTCSSLTSIVIPDGVTFIPGHTFNNCYGLTSVTIGSGVTTILSEAFDNCSSLSSITCYATTAPTIETYTFYGVKSNGVLYYPSGSDYSSWMKTSAHYLGYYGWTGQEITA